MVTNPLSNAPVVIMAGGKGVRMRPYTNVIPKPLLICGSDTMIENVINLFAEYGFRRFYFVLCHRKELITAYLQSLDLPFDMQYIYEETPLGTAGGLKLLENELDGDFILCNCDNLGKFDYASLLKQHAECRADITILVKKHTHTIPFGIVRGSDTGKVYSIIEKPDVSFFISTGIHIVNPAVLSLIKQGTRLDMPELINTASEKMNVRMVDIGNAEWIDMSVAQHEQD